MMHIKLSGNGNFLSYHREENKFINTFVELSISLKLVTTFIKSNIPGDCQKHLSKTIKSHVLAAWELVGQAQKITSIWSQKNRQPTLITNLLNLPNT